MWKSDFIGVLLVSATVLGAMLVGQAASAPAAVTTAAPGFHDDDVTEHAEEFPESTSETPAGFSDEDSSDEDEQMTEMRRDERRPESAAAAASFRGDDDDSSYFAGQQQQMQDEFSEFAREAPGFRDADIETAEQLLMRDERPEYAAAAASLIGHEDGYLDGQLLQQDERRFSDEIDEQLLSQERSPEFQFGDAMHHRKRRQTARLCKWMGDHIGYRCDGPVERAVWRGIQRVRGVHDCSSMCQSQGRSGGSCRPGAVDRSTWCPQGQSCRCN